MKWLMSKSEWDHYFSSSSSAKLTCFFKMVGFCYKCLISPRSICRSLSKHMGRGLRKLLALYHWLLTTGDLQARHIRYAPGIININVRLHSRPDNIFQLMVDS